MGKINNKILVGIFLTVFLMTYITAQVIQTQVIELTEKVKDYFIESIKGNIKGQEALNQFGINVDVGTVEEDIQSQGGILTFLQSAEFISIISSDTTNDILTGSNATSVLIQGLNANFTEISEIVNLSATTTNTTNQYIRVNRMTVNEVGNYSVSNAGTITGTAQPSGTIQIQIPIGQAQSKSTHYTVPAGKNLIVTAFRVTVDTGKVIDISFRFRENADDIIPPMSPVETIRDVRGINNPFSGLSKGNLHFDEKTDIWAVASTSTGTSAIEINYDYIQYAIGT